MTDTGTMVICNYNQPLACAQDFHVEFDYFLSEDPGEDYVAMQLTNVGDLSLIFATETSTITGTVGETTLINESFTLGNNAFGAFNKVQLTFYYLADLGTTSQYSLKLKFNNAVFNKRIEVDTTQMSQLFTAPMTVSFNGFSGTRLKNIVFNEVSCTTLGATCVQLLYFDSDDTVSLIYDHSGNENDVIDTNNAEIILKNN